ncbi:MAG: transposase [Bacteroidia bacterium]|nr:transposase [Bacteroidia bacterium]
MSNKRKRYGREFKIRVVEKSDRVENISNLAFEIGIRPELIYRWHRRCRFMPLKITETTPKSSVGGKWWSDCVRRIVVRNGFFRCLSLQGRRLLCVGGAEQVIPVFA